MQIALRSIPDILGFRYLCRFPRFYRDGFRIWQIADVGAALWDDFLDGVFTGGQTACQYGSILFCGNRSNQLIVIGIDFIFPPSDAATVRHMEKKYPDAAFALNISSNLFFHDRELTDIHMKAYSAILKGDPIASIHFRYDREMDAYHTRHNWD